MVKRFLVNGTPNLATPMYKVVDSLCVGVPSRSYPFDKAFRELAEGQNALSDALFSVKSDTPPSVLGRRKAMKVA